MFCFVIYLLFDIRVAPSSIWTPLLDDVLKSVPNPLEAKQMCANSQVYTFFDNEKLSNYM